MVFHHYHFLPLAPFLLCPPPSIYPSSIPLHMLLHPLSSLFFAEYMSRISTVWKTLPLTGRLISENKRALIKGTKTLPHITAHRCARRLDAALSECACTILCVFVNISNFTCGYVCVVCVIYCIRMYPCITFVCSILIMITQVFNYIVVDIIVIAVIYSIY